MFFQLKHHESCHKLIWVHPYTPPQIGDRRLEISVTRACLLDQKQFLGISGGFWKCNWNLEGRVSRRVKSVICDTIDQSGSWVYRKLVKCDLFCRNFDMLWCCEDMFPLPDAFFDHIGCINHVLREL